MYRIFSSYYGQVTVANTPEKAYELAVAHLWAHLDKTEQQDATVTVKGGGLTYTIAKDVDKA